MYNLNEIEMQADNHGSSLKRSMDWDTERMKSVKKMKMSYGSRSVLKECRSVDRLTCLPDELLSRIVSLLPIKQVAATQILCKKMRKLAFDCITSVDLDDSPLSHCRHYPHRPDRFPLFVSFVDHVLNHLSQPLTRFRLHVGGDKTNYFPRKHTWHSCWRVCFPHFQPSRLNTWISYPLAHRGLRELDLSFHVVNPSQCRLPHQLFACHFLEVLKLDSNLNLDADEFSLISLPNLKRLHLYSFVIVRDDFLTRVVSCCPSLEDLECAYCRWIHSDRLAVCSQSLRRLVLVIYKHEEDEEKNSNLVLIDTPNLQYFHYDDNLAFHYSITNMNALVQANLTIMAPSQFDSAEISYQMQLNLVRLVSNVQHLSLLGYSVENIHFGGESKDQLPMFHNLKTLELGGNASVARWDITLLEILACSPNLETLAFPEGFLHSAELEDIQAEVADLEDEGWGSSEATPLCFQSNLKRIMVQKYYGTAKELSLIKFLLQKASILHELEIICYSENMDVVPTLELASTLMELPRASITCSIRVS